MNDSAKLDRAMAIQDAIRHILNEDWNPIPMKKTGILDEYDSYIGGVYRILASSRSENDLIDFLSKVEVEFMGFNPPQRDKLKPVAIKLLALDVKL